VLPASYLAWALFRIHYPSPAQVTSQRSIVLESADRHRLLHHGLFRLPPVAAKDMPPDVVNAVLSIEDHDFYRHGALDPWSMARALKQDLEAGRIVSGGSTISQQLAKILFLNPHRTYQRKIQEAAVAIWLEQHLSKDQILTSYLNNVYLGSGAVGVPAAAELYFDKSVSDLTLPEAAMLSGMINAPSKDDPLRNLAAARARAATVLDAMVTNGKRSPEAALVAKLHPAAPDPANMTASSAGWFADWVYDQVAHAAPAQAGAVHVDTTLDLRLQKLAADIVDSTLAAYGAPMHVTQAALVAMKPDGAVVAMVGGRSYAASQYNRAVQAKRQPGSAFKLFDYYAAFRHGYSPDDQILDEPIEIKGWKPHNYRRLYHGRVTLAQAFAHSLNAATVRLSQEVGIDDVIAAARDLGLRAPLHNNPSLALGTGELSLLDLTAAYAAVRAGSAPVEPWGIASFHIVGQNESLQVGRPNQPRHDLGGYRDELLGLLQDVVERGTGRAAALPGLVGGKTGTTQDYRDAWFIGFDNALVVGVWVGNDDHSPMRGVTGGSLPAAIWKRFMESAEGAGAPTAPQAQAQPSQAVPPLAAPAAQASHGVVDQANANLPGLQNPQCNIPLCQRLYHSFRASDCTYQPSRGGPRRVCRR
jgi:1A family penicillin-binding protein